MQASMLDALSTRILRPVLLAFLGLSLAACSDVIAEITGPTHRHIIQTDLEELERVAENLEVEDAGDLLDESIRVIGLRIDAIGGHVHVERKLGEGRVLLETSNIEGDDLISLIGAAGRLEFLEVDEESSMSGSATVGSKMLPMTYAGFESEIGVKRFGGISGRRVENAAVGIDPYTNESVVNIQFDTRGGEQFAQLSTKLVGKRFAIVVDDEVVSAPFFNEPILGGQAQISGGFTAAEANQLAVMLQSGALETPFELIETSVIGE